MKRLLLILPIAFAAVLASAQTIDVSETSSSFSRSGPAAYWWESTRGDGGHMYYTRSSDEAHGGVSNTGTWRPNLPKRGIWRVSAYIPGLNADTTNARYSVQTLNGTQQVRLNQAVYFDKFVSLGEFAIDSGASGTVTLDDLTGEGWNKKSIGFDTIRYEYLRDLPTSNPPTIQILGTNMIQGHFLRVDYGVRNPDTKQVSVQFNFRFPDRTVSTAVSFDGQTSYVRNVTIDLATRGVARFTRNALVSLNALASNDAGSSSDTKSLEILLPVILIPGICLSFDHLGGGDGTFPEMESFLTTTSTHPEKGNFSTGYNLRASGSNYPNLATLEYSRDFDSFSEGGKKLASLIEVMKNGCYANKVQLIGHSKGGLVARSFLEFLGGGPSTFRYISVDTPHTGCVWARTGRYAMLYPTYPWFRLKPFGDYTRLQPSDSLDNLNSVKLPEGPQYSLIFSNSITTPAFGTGPIDPRTNLPYIWKFTGGDGVVTDFSQMGYLNNPVDGAAPVVIDAMKGMAIERYQLAGYHSDVMSNSIYESIIYQRIYRSSF